MIASKHIEKTVAVIVSVTVILCLLAMLFSDALADTLGGSGVSLEYESELFDTSDIISLNIIMDEADWSDLLENAINEEYYKCDVVINGTTFYSVGIRAKGNTSLSTIASDSTTDRYSLKLEFDHYVDGQTCFGLDKLILNNNYADATNMKEAIVYDMFAYLGADASLYNYADIAVNGETWGVYLALEAVEDSFLLRNYGAGSGELYKPDSMNVGGAGGTKDTDNSQDMPDMNSDQTMPGAAGGGTPPDMSGGQSTTDTTDGTQTTPDMSSMPEMPEDFDPSSGDGTDNLGDRGNGGGGNFGGGGAGDMGMSGSGADLNYVDDELDSYSTIWDGEVGSTGTKDHERVVEALKNISEQTDVETYLDADNMLRYMAVHTFVVNLDSLSGSMAHNYYLYEDDGQLNLIPWDYNLAFGGFQSGGSSSASETINFPIDTPFSGSITLEDRQFFAALLENEEYLAQYHEYLQLLAEEYVGGGMFEETYTRIRSQIDALVENDPNAFYTADEYDAAAQMLYSVVSLRAESVSGQLDGTIPSTSDGMSADSSTLVDASGINLSVMGTMGGGSGGSGMGFGNMPDDATSTSGTQTDDAATADGMTLPDGMTMPEGMTRPDEIGQTGTTTTSGSSTLVWYGVSLLVLALALVIAKLYKRR